MKILKNKINILLIIFAGLFTACEDVVEVDLGDETPDLYAVEARITTESNPYVYLYKSQRVDNDSPYNGLSEARVVISNDGQPEQKIMLTEHPGFKGLYIVPQGHFFLGQTGNNYTVTIEVDDVTLTATDTLARVEPIDSIQVRPSLRGDFLFLGVFTYGNEPAEMGNFYKWNIHINDSLLSNASNIVIASDELVNGNYINGFEIFTDFHDPNSPEERTLDLGDTIQVLQTSISEFAYNYYFQMMNQSQTGSLFSVPPANVPGNFTASDGSIVLGLFTAHDVSKSNVIIIDEQIESQLKD